MATRGIVFGVQALIHSDGRPVWPLPQPEDLRRYALYWDLIDFPHANAMSFALEKLPDFATLRKRGVLLESNLVFMRNGEILINPERQSYHKHTLGLGLKGSLTSLKNLELKGQLLLATRHNQYAPDQAWSIANSVLDQYIPTKPTAKTVEVELVSCILSPGKDVPMGDIFKFKDERLPELLRFRNALDTLYLDIANNADLDRAFIRAKEEVISSVLTINRLMKESRLQRVLSSLRVRVRLNDNLINESIQSALASAGMAALLGKPLELGATIGVVLPTVVFGLVKAFQKVELPPSCRDFLYAYEAGQYLD